MVDQTLTSQLVQLPGWLQAAWWGLLSASGLLIGAVGGYYTSLQHKTIARVTTDPGSVPRLTAMQRSAAGRWFVVLLILLVLSH